MDYQQILSLFAQNASEKHNEYSNVINSKVKSLGCTTPTIRQIAKKLNLVVEEALQLPVNCCYELDFLRGIVVSGAKLKFEDKRKFLLEFASTIENWAVCDCNTVKVPRSERQQYFKFFSSLCADERPFVCRYGLVNLINNYLDGEYVNKTFDVLKNVSQWGNYYVDMACAWLVATAMSKQRNATVAFLTSDAPNVMNVFSYNKALQKIRDSHRVSDEDKLWTKTLKRTN